MRARGAHNSNLANVLVVNALAHILSYVHSDCHPVSYLKGTRGIQNYSSVVSSSYFSTVYCTDFSTYFQKNMAD
jgi:hypothetical protein